MKIQVLLLLLGLFNNCFCQGNFEKLILKSGNSTFSIRFKRIHYFKVIETKEDNSFLILTKTNIGDVVSSTSDEIVILPTQLSIYKVDKDSIIYNYKTIYPKHLLSSISIKSSNISNIAIQSKSAYNCQVLGVIFTVLGSITTSIAAPLLSINYENGQINSKTYYKIAAAGLGCMVVGLPLIFSSYPRKFDFKYSKESKGKVWKIEN